MIAMQRRTFLKTAGYAALYGGLIADFSKSALALTPKEIVGSDPDLHLLRRISFGPTAQELARVRQIGRSAYIDEQLGASDAATDLTVAALYPLTSLDPTGLFVSSGSGFTIDTHIAELQSAMVYRAIFSSAQLYEVMVDFWNDHFNTYIKKNPIPLKLDFDRRVIRPNALGNFKTLMRATAHHPEMLYYLDNWMNAKGAINENYARELLELHTLGKDGGYTEADMKALSHILTGLTYPIDPLAGTVIGYGAYAFDANRHDSEEKTFLGEHFPAGGGEAEINRALDLILAHPGTARFIARKLCVRFVADAPSDALVEQIAGVFTSTQGDIRAMLSAILKSDEFAQSPGLKFKRPQDAMIGAVRACGLNRFDQLLNTDIFGSAVTGGGVLMEGLRSAGQLPFNWVPPNGYPDRMSYWGNTNSLLQQERFVVRLVETLSYSRVLSDPADAALLGNSVAVGVARAKTPRQAVDNSIANLLFTDLPADARGAALAFVAQDANPDAEMEAAELEKRVKGLVFALLSSPWFLLR